MRAHIASVLILASALSAAVLGAEPLRDVRDVAPDLESPRLSDGDPAAGKRVKIQLPEFAGTELFHTLYLPTNWKLGSKHAVIFEYPGNGPYENKLGDTNSGRVEDCNLGYGISAGNDFIWVCLPFVDPESKQHQLQWWGDAEATARYGQAAVKQVCTNWGGDPERLVLCGFSRGAIACNYIGLRDDEIARLWRCMVVHSHYDGVRRWPYDDSDSKSALTRIQRLACPQFITHETSVEATRNYLQAIELQEKCPPPTLLALPFPNHTSGWVLRPLQERQQLRDWVVKRLGSTLPKP